MEEEKQVHQQQRPSFVNQVSNVEKKSSHDAEECISEEDQSENPAVSTVERPSQVSVPQKGKLKLDQGFKSVLRGFRKGLKCLFFNKGTPTKEHHWSIEKWEVETTKKLF